MKRDELRQLHKKPMEELSGMLSARYRDLENVLVQRASGKLHNTALVGKMKREIAQILTVIQMRSHTS